MEDRSPFSNLRTNFQKIEEYQMTMARNNLLLAAFIVITLVMPVVAGSSLSTPRLISPVHESSSAGKPLATIETMASVVDPWGGVYNIIATLQNASLYGYTHVQAIENIVKNQMQNDDGYVSMAALVAEGMVPFPNGVVGAPMVTLEIQVNPVLVVPLNRSLVAFADLSESEAIAIAEEVVSAYESALSISLERFMIVEMSQSTTFHYGIGSISCHGTGYMLTYVAVLTAAQGTTAMTSLKARLAALGGFMSLVGATDWPGILTTAAEVYIPYYYVPFYDESPYAVVEMLISHDPYIRADVSETDLAGVVLSTVAAEAAFMEPGYVQSGTGAENYSLKNHVAYSGDIVNKMAEDSSGDSISLVGGFAPGSLEISGIPSEWLSIDDQFKVPTEIDIGPITIPENSTVSDIIKTYLSYMPRMLALEVNDMISGLPSDFLDDYIDDLWGGGLWPDIRAAVLAFNYSSIETPVIEMNYDVLALVMKSAGMTPDQLISRIDDSLAATNPVAALVKAFVSYFDSYHLLDILEPDYYASPTALEGYLNTLGEGVQTFLKDFAGIDLPNELKTKEAIATFVEEHWDILLQALWDGMADGDLLTIKNAVHAILNAENFQSHITPYLMADLGSSLLAGVGFEFAINMNESMSAFLPLNVADVTLTFESDPESLVFTGPYLAVVKGAETRTVTAGSNVTYTITVHNYGTSTAYDVKVLDGMNAGLDGARPFYWTRSSLAAGATWTINYQVRAATAGLYMDMPAICVYFNATLGSFDPANATLWTGSARYTLSAPGYQINVQGAGGWLPTSLFGIPTLYVVAGVGGVAVLGVVLLVIRRR